MQLMIFTFMHVEHTENANDTVFKSYYYAYCSSWLINRLIYMGKQIQNHTYWNDTYFESYWPPFSDFQCRLIVSQMSSTRCELLNWLLLPLAVAVGIAITFPSLELATLLIMASIATIAHIHYGVYVVSIGRKTEKQKWSSSFLLQSVQRVIRFCWCLCD